MALTPTDPRDTLPTSDIAPRTLPADAQPGRAPLVTIGGSALGLALLGGAVFLTRRQRLARRELRRRLRCPAPAVQVRQVTLDAPDDAPLTQPMGREADFADAELAQVFTHRAYGGEVEPAVAIAHHAARFFAEHAVREATVLLAVQEQESDASLLVGAPRADQDRIVDLAPDLGRLLGGKAKGVPVRGGGDVEVRFKGLTDNDLLALLSDRASSRLPTMLPLVELPDRRQLYGNWDALGHLLVAGLPGEGADIVLTGLVALIASRRHPDTLRLWTIAGPQVLPDELFLFPHWGGEQGHERIDPTDSARVTALFADLREELDLRRGEPGDTVRPDLVVVLGELADLIGNDDLGTTLALLAADGPGYGIRLLAATVKADRLEEGVVRHFTTRLVLHLADEAQSMRLLGAPDALDLEGGGQLLLRLTDRTPRNFAGVAPMRTRGFRVGAEALAQLAREMRGAYGDADEGPRMADDVLASQPRAEDKPLVAVAPLAGAPSSPASQAAGAVPSLDHAAPVPEAAPPTAAGGSDRDAARNGPLDGMTAPPAATAAPDQAGDGDDGTDARSGDTVVQEGPGADRASRADALAEAPAPVSAVIFRPSPHPIVVATPADRRSDDTVAAESGRPAGAEWDATTDVTGQNSQNGNGHEEYAERGDVLVPLSADDRAVTDRPGQASAAGQEVPSPVEPLPDDGSLVVSEAPRTTLRAREREGLVADEMARERPGPAPSAALPAVADEYAVTTPLEFRCFGRQFQVLHHGTPLLPLRHRQAWRLAQYLAAQPHRSVTRSKLLATFWPDAPDDSENVKNTIRRLRDELTAQAPDVPREVVHQGRNGECWLDHRYVTVDVHVFLDLIDRAPKFPDLDAALAAYRRVEALYRPELLEASGEEWLDERLEGLSLVEEYQHDWRQFVLRLARRCVNERCPDLAMPLYQRLMRDKPLDEVVLREFLRCYGATGNRQGFTREYRTFEQALCKQRSDEEDDPSDPGYDPALDGPEPETRRVHDEVLRLFDARAAGEGIVASRYAGAGDRAQGGVAATADGSGTVPHPAVLPAGS